MSEAEQEGADQRDLENIQLSTDAITFNEPFNVDKIEQIRLTNSTDKRIGFKVKTTRPLVLSTRPAFGMLEGRTSMNVEAKFRRVPAFESPPEIDHLTFLFAVIPESKASVKPWEFWQSQDGPPKTVRRVVVPITYRRFKKEQEDTGDGTGASESSESTSNEDSDSETDSSETSEDPLDESGLKNAEDASESQSKEEEAKAN